MKQLDLLYRHMKESSAVGLEFDIGGGEKIRLARKSAVVGAAAGSFPGLAGVPAALAMATATGLKVTAALSGVFYRASSPESAAFVEEGSQVNSGDVLCIIEAMKVMNEIRASKPGKVIQILGQNGKHVKKGDVIFMLEPGK